MILYRSRFLALLAALCLPLGIHAETPSAGGSIHPHEHHALDGKMFPAFSASDLNGHTIALNQFRGKTVLVSFYFARCSPCIAEAPVLTGYHRTHPDVPVLAITFDDKATATQFVRERGLNWPVIYDQRPLAETLGVHTYPLMVLVGPDGTIKQADIPASFTGDAPLTVSALEAWIKQAG
jgi:peroxiredoxin